MRTEGYSTPRAEEIQQKTTATFRPWGTPCRVYPHVAFVKNYWSENDWGLDIMKRASGRKMGEPVSHWESRGGIGGKNMCYPISRTKGDPTESQSAPSLSSGNPWRTVKLNLSSFPEGWSQGGEGLGLRVWTQVSWCRFPGSDRGHSED